MLGNGQLGRRSGRRSTSGRGGEGRTAVGNPSSRDTQYPGSRDAAALRYVVIGLDFGTAFTKVVIADKSDSYAVRLRPRLSGIDAYLLPGLLRQGANKTYALAESKSDDGVLDNLKLGLIERPKDPLTIANAAAFLALVLQRARLEFMRREQDIFGRNRLDWHLNIGLPAESYANEALVAAFRTVAWAAWTLSVSTTRIDPARALVAARDAMRLEASAARYAPIADRLLHPDRVQAIPEVVAETVSYARSPLRNDGLHLLIDVGAGTLDVNAFNLLVHQGDDRYVLFLPKVQPLGSVYLARHRIERLREKRFALDGVAVSLSDEYGSWPVREDLESALKLPRGTVAKLDGSFLDRVGHLLWDDVLLKIRKDYEHRIHDWRKPVPTFLAGGGSADAAYLERVGKLSNDMERNGQGGLAVRALPMPGRFRHTGIAEGHFHRVAVAYGLAHDPLDMGDIIPPSHIPPPATLRVEVGNWTDRYVSADQM